MDSVFKFGWFGGSIIDLIKYTHKKNIEYHNVANGIELVIKLDVK